MGRIVIVLDDRLSRQKAALLTRMINALRQIAEIHVLRAETSEDELLHKLETTPYQLVLAPWYRYLSWSKVEAFYGLTRTSGPTFAGYRCEQLQPYELGIQANHFRIILLDFLNMSPRDIVVIARALVQDTQRSGIRPLHDPNTPIYCETWMMGQGLGGRMDSVLALPEVTHNGWIKRSNSIRISLSALWSLIYEEGPGKSELAKAINQATPRASFQVGADRQCMSLRLCYSMANWSPKDALQTFWPDPKLPSRPAQLLLKYADFVRVHTIPENSQIEVVVGFLNSAPAERSFGEVHTLWIEPLAAHLMTEIPFETPNSNARHLRPLPVLAAEPRAGTPTPTPAVTSELSINAKAKERFIFEAAVKIRELKGLLTARDEIIKELRAGGVGTAPPLPPPDAEGLLEAFQERYFQARYEIRQFETQIAELEERGSTPQEVEALRLKMSQLAQREQGWIKKLIATLEIYREAKKEPKTNVR